MEMENLTVETQGEVGESVSLPKRKRAENDVVDESLRENSTAAEDLLQKVLGNHLIFSNIMKKLKTRDLVTCRLVNSFWKEAADSVLVQRTDLKAIDIRFCKEKGKFCINSYTSRDLSELQNLLEDPHSNCFPCHTFKIEGPLKHPDLQKFLSSPRCGGQIKNLYLNFTTFTKIRVTTYDPDAFVPKRYNNSLGYLRKLLTEQAVNLNSLTLYSTNSVFNSENPEAGNLFPSPVILPELTHLQINRCPRRHLSDNEIRWMKDLLAAAPNLTSFSTEETRTETLDTLINVNKSHLLTEMIVDNNSSGPEDGQLLSQFKLKKLTAQSRFLYDHPYISETSLRVLRLNADTLTSVTLDLRHAVASLPTSEVFVHVKRFCLVGFEKIPVENASKISLQELFPNLKTIRLEGSNNAVTPNPGTEVNFPFVVGETMDKVKTLEIQHVCPVDWLKLLPQVFPSVIHLVLENYWDFPRSGHLFWAFTSLKFMDLGLLLGIDNLDPVFTGFDKTTCEELRERSTRALGQLAKSGAMEIETEEEIQKMRVAPSFVQLKELTELRIKVADTDPDDDDELENPYHFIEGGNLKRSRKRWSPASRPSNVDLLSPVTSVYAFEMMPSLQGVDILLTPNEAKFLPEDTSGLSRLQELEAALIPMAEHPLVTLYPIQMNN